MTSWLCCLCSVQEKLVCEMKRLVQEEVVAAVKDQQSMISDQILDVVRTGACIDVVRAG